MFTLFWGVGAQVLNLLPLRILGGTIAAISIALGMLLTYFFPGTDVMASAFRAFSFFSGLIFVFVIIGWRWVWKWKPVQKHTFPNLRGVWKGHIKFLNESAPESRAVLARIEQSLSHIDIRLVSELSESNTLSASPTRDAPSGKKTLFYVYRNEVRRPNSNATTHIGSAQLEAILAKAPTLRGNYFTDRGRSGEIELVRHHADPDKFDDIRRALGW